MIKKLLVSIVVVCVGVVAHAQQSREEIQRQQQNLQKEIADLNNTYNEIKKNKKQSLSQLALVQRKINAREELLKNLNRDVRQIDDNIYLTTLEINRMKRELDTLKENYAKSLVFAYKNRSNYDYLNFIFSATSFNDAFKRVAYLKSYRQFRETQADNIVKTQTVLQQKAGILANSKVEISSAIKEQGKQLEVLEEDKKEKDRVVQDLKDRETDIAAEIKTREKTRQKLSQALQAVIRREKEEAQRRAIELAKKQKEEEDRKKREADAAKAAAAKNNNSTAGTSPAKAQPPATSNPVSGNSDEPVKTGVVNTNASNRKYDPLESTTEGLTLSLNFENNKGRLPWPADAGVVIIPYGTYTIPGTKLKGVSDGIVIALPVGANIKAVADGEVTAVTDIGGQQVVILIHGKYFTTYSNLSTVNVSKGQKVKPGTVLGKAAEGSNGEGQLTFMVSNDRTNYNPETWLRRK